MKILLAGLGMQYPLGLGSIAAYLMEKDHEFDSGNLRVVVLKKQIHVEQLLREAGDCDIIGLSLFTSSYVFMDDLARQIKTINKNILLIGGGYHATLIPTDLDNSHFDLFVIGDGEEPFYQIVQEFKKEKPNYSNIPGIVEKGKEGFCKKPVYIADLDVIPPPYRDEKTYRELLKDENIHYFIFSRGCPHDCSFCSNHAFKKNCNSLFFRFRSPQQCIVEIEKTIETFGIPERIILDDDLLNYDWGKDSEGKEFIDLYRERIFKKYETKIPFICNLRPSEELTDGSLFLELKEAGCEEVEMGIESGCFSIRKEILGRDITDEVIKTCFLKAKGSGLETLSFNLIGLPGETPEMFDETIRINKECEVDYPLLYVFYPYPGTILYEKCITEKYIRPEYYKSDRIKEKFSKFGFEYVMNYERHSYSMLEMKGFSKGDIAKKRVEFIDTFKDRFKGTKYNYLEYPNFKKSEIIFEPKGFFLTQYVKELGKYIEKKELNHKLEVQKNVPVEFPVLRAEIKGKDNRRGGKIEVTGVIETASTFFGNFYFSTLKLKIENSEDIITWGDTNAVFEDISLEKIAITYDNEYAILFKEWFDYCYEDPVLKENELSKIVDEIINNLDLITTNLDNESEEGIKVFQLADYIYSKKEYSKLIAILRNLSLFLEQEKDRKKVNRPNELFEDAYKKILELSKFIEIAQNILCDKKFHFENTSNLFEELIILCKITGDILLTDNYSIVTESWIQCEHLLLVTLNQLSQLKIYRKSVNMLAQYQANMFRESLKSAQKFKTSYDNQVGFAIQLNGLIEQNRINDEKINSYRIAAAITIMSRNFAHNIGSHALEHYINDLKFLSITNSYLPEAIRRAPDKIVSFETELQNMINTYVDNISLLETFLCDYVRTDQSLFMEYIKDKTILWANFSGQRGRRITTGFSITLGEIVDYFNSSNILKRNIAVFEDVESFNVIFKKEEDRGKKVFIPYCKPGLQALYSIFENIIRNVKHWTSKPKSKFTFFLVLDAIDNPCSSYYVITLSDYYPNIAGVLDPKIEPDTEKPVIKDIKDKIEERLRHDIIDDLGNPIISGINEMKIASAILYNMDFTRIAFEPGDNPEGFETIPFRLTEEKDRIEYSLKLWKWEDEKELDERFMKDYLDKKEELSRIGLLTIQSDVFFELKEDEDIYPYSDFPLRTMIVGSDHRTEFEPFPTLTKENEKSLGKWENWCQWLFKKNKDSKENNEFPFENRKIYSDTLIGGKSTDIPEEKLRKRPPTEFSKENPMGVEADTDKRAYFQILHNSDENNFNPKDEFGNYVVLKKSDDSILIGYTSTESWVQHQDDSHFYFSMLEVLESKVLFIEERIFDSVSKEKKKIMNQLGIDFIRKNPSGNGLSVNEISIEWDDKKKSDKDPLEVIYYQFMIIHTSHLENIAGYGKDESASLNILFKTLSGRDEKIREFNGEERIKRFVEGISDKVKFFIFTSGKDEPQWVQDLKRDKSKKYRIKFVDYSTLSHWFLINYTLDSKWRLIKGLLNL